MYTHGKFPVLEQHFEWYRPTLSVKSYADGSGGFIAAIDMATGNIHVGRVFEFLSYKVQLFVIYKLISLFSQIDNTDQVSECTMDKEDAFMVRLLARLPHVAPEFFERLLITLKTKSLETNDSSRPKTVCLMFPRKPYEKSKLNRPAVHKKHNSF